MTFEQTLALIYKEWPFITIDIKKTNHSYTKLCFKGEEIHFYYNHITNYWLADDGSYNTFIILKNYFINEIYKIYGRS